MISAIFSTRTIGVGSGILRFVLFGFSLFFVSFPSSVSSELVWPELELPSDMQSFYVGEKVSVNGIPVRIQGFLSRRSQDDLAIWFHQKMGKPLMDDQINGKRILGRMKGNAYITVQLEKVGNGSRGVIAVTQPLLAIQYQKKSQELKQLWLSKMLPGSQLQSQVLSEDSNRYSTHLTFSNSYSLAANGDAIKRALEIEGYQMEYVALTTETQSQKHLSRPLYFRGKNKHAMALIKPGNESGTIIVLNLINTLEKMQ